MAVYGNTVLREKNEETNYTYITIEKDGVEVTLGFPKMEVLKENSQSTKRIGISKDGTDVELMVRSRKGQGGMAGNISKHDASIKILKPSKYGKLSVKVPHVDKGEITVTGSTGSIIPKEVKISKEFADKNRSDLRAIFYSENDDHVKNSYKHMIRTNIDIITSVKGDNDPYIVDYFEKKKKEYENGKRK